MAKQFEVVFHETREYAYTICAETESNAIERAEELKKRLVKFDHSSSSSIKLLCVNEMVNLFG